MTALDPRLSPFAGKRVLVTGHTGFKGAWLCAWLNRLGAEVHGFALPPLARGSFHDLHVAEFTKGAEVDVRDGDAVDAAVAAIEPDLVLHLAAQPLVRLSWVDRRSTFATNVMGTVNVLEAALRLPSTKGVVCITTDKVYENTEHGRPFVETDRIGGHDPYSASKAAAEIAITPYRSPVFMGFAAIPVVSVRAGNVIGGGDWSADRLIPDVARAVEAQEPIVLRRPDAVRPWQHVLDCLHGYLLVGAAMLEGRSLSPSYNLAHDDANGTVFEVTKSVLRHWEQPEDMLRVEREDDSREAQLLRLDPALAQSELGWDSAWSLEESIRETVRFYRDPSVGLDQIDEHMRITAP